MASPGSVDSDTDQTLFQNRKFWLSSTVPQRRFFKADIEKNGGQVVLLEKDADILLVDHAKRDAAPDTYSYQFVEQSIRKRKLQELEKFRVGRSSASIRNIGSSTVPTKSRRTAYSARDDQILFDWMKPFEAKGGKIRGNKIYQLLEEKHPQHPWQSWRERYLKKVRDLPRPVVKGLEQESPRPEPSMSQGNGIEHSASNTQSPYASFTKSDKRELLEFAKLILEIDPAQEDDCWAEFAEHYDTHSASEWKNYFHTFIRPLHEAKVRSKRDSNNSSPETKKTQGPLASTATVDNGEPSDFTRRSKLGQQTNGGESSRRWRSNHAQETGDKRRRTLPDSMSSIEFGDTTNGPPRKRRATDYISREVPTSLGRIAEERASTSPLNSPSPHRYNTGKQPLRSPKQLSSKAKGKQPLKRQRSTISPSDSEEAEFETAPQFPGLESIFAQPTQIENELDHSINTSYSNVPITPTKNLKEPEEDEDGNQELDDWIQARARREGLDEEQVIDALRCTSMDTGLADAVIKHLKTGKGIPDNMKGVWTKEDDETISGADARAIKAVEDKHGPEHVNARFEYLQIVNDLMIEGSEE